MTEMEYNLWNYFMFSVVYIQLLHFHYFRMSPSYLQREQVFFNGACNVGFPCFYIRPEWTNQTLAQERTFLVFTLPDGQGRFSYMPGKDKGKGYSVGCNLKPYCQIPLKPTHWSCNFDENKNSCITFISI